MNNTFFYIYGKYSLNEYNLCTIDKNSPNILKVECLCSTLDNRKIIMNLTENKAKELKLDRIIILIPGIPDKLKDWYESIGYSYVTSITSFSSNTQKLYQMEKFI